MSFSKVQGYLKELDLADRIKVLSASSATVEAAAEAIGCEPEHIAKSMSFLVNDNPLLVVFAGDARVDNHKFKQEFSKKPKMISADQVEKYIGHKPGGVCPFALNDGVPVYLDNSLKRFETVYPAAGDAHSVVKLSLTELETASNPLKWVDVGKDWQE